MADPNWKLYELEQAGLSSSEGAYVRLSRRLQAVADKKGILGTMSTEHSARTRVAKHLTFGYYNVKFPLIRGDILKY
jgi:hypothetical protein